MFGTRFVLANSNCTGPRTVLGMGLAPIVSDPIPCPVPGFGRAQSEYTIRVGVGPSQWNFP